MNNALVKSQGASGRSRLYRGLNRTARMLRDVLDAAVAINTNFTFCEHRGEQLSLLDTDFVRSSLRVHGAVSFFTQIDVGRDVNPPDDPLSELGSRLEQQARTLIGAQTLRHIVSDLVAARPRQRYALPPGTQYELLRQIKPVQQSLQARARNLLSRFDSALKSKDPVHALQESGVISRLPDVLPPVLDDFIAAYDDATLLRQIFKHAQPVDELLPPEPPLGIEQTYSSALNLLNNLDASHDRNHAIDAANVALLVWMLSGPRRNGVIPVLISSTRGLALAGNSLQEAIWLALDRAQRQELAGRDRGAGLLLTPRAREELSIVNSHFYLMIWQRLAQQGWSSQGARQNAAALAAATNSLLATIGSLRATLQGDFRASRFNIFALQLEEYLCEWQGVLGPLRHDAKNDSISLRNTVLSQEFEQLLLAQPTNKESARSVRERVRGVYNGLLELAKEEAEVDRLVAGTSQSKPDPVEHFIFTGYPRKRSLQTLKEWRAGDGLTIPWRSSERVVIHSRFMPWEGALFAVDLQRNVRNSKEPHVQLTWSHVADVRQLAVLAAEACSGLLGPSDTFDVSIFFSKFLKREPVAGRNLREWLEDELLSSPYPDSFEIAANGRAITLDVEPTGTERRGSIRFPLIEWEGPSAALVAFAARTKELFISETYVRWALDQVATSFRSLPFDSEAG
jgi:hypothetical protein